MRYICTNCGYIYNEEEGDKGSGVTPGTKFEELPTDWVCPVCYVTTDLFDPMD